MKENIEKLSKYHSEFDLIWNEYGREAHRMIRNEMHGKLLLKELSDWYVKGKSIITEMEKLFSNASVRVIKLPQKAAGLSFNPGDYLQLNDDCITIFDNYDVSEEQMKKYRKNHPNLIAIDDLGDRIFDVDIIINQNYRSDKLEYRTIKETRLFLGERYVLLRKNILKVKRKNHF